MASPTTITPTLPGLALIAYDDGIDSVDTSAADATLNWDTWDRYENTTGGSVNLVYSMAQARSANYVLIAGHNLGSNSVAVTVSTRSTIGSGTYTARVTSYTPSNNEPIYITFDAATVGDVKVTISDDCEIARVMCGTSLEMPTPIYGGHNPIVLNERNEYKTSVSESGQFLGRTVQRRGLETGFEFKNLEADWVRSDFVPFVQHCRRYPFGIAWRGTGFNAGGSFTNVCTDTAYCHTTQDISLTNSGGRDLMTASMQVRGHNDV